MVAGLASISALALAGCSTGARRDLQAEAAAQARLAAMYGPRPDEKFPIPAVKLDRIDPQFYRQRVRYDTNYPPGTVLVDTNRFFLHLVEPDGMAMRYGVGLGRAGFEWSGGGHIAWRRTWPRWTPPAEMIAREPRLEQWSAANGGMEPGLRNPLGSRALYIFEGNQDTLYRLHGSLEERSIGKAVSSGCVRLLNQDVIDLYERVPKRARIIVT
ncbi:MAG: L,D-transpeptidase [Pseudomonadota bacterium]